MKKALIIAYHFPPDRTAGIYRPVKFAKYLPEFGWEPIILSVKNSDDSSADESLLKDLPDNIRIYRAFSLELGRFENWLYKRIFARSSDQDGSFEKELVGVQQEAAAETKRKPSLPKRLIFTPARRFLQNTVHTPDDKIGWIPFAIIRGLKLIRREKIDLIFSTSPPESDHIIAMWLSRLTGKPFIADFRDPFTTHYTKKNLPALADRLPYISPRRLSFERGIERNILERASFTVHTGSGRMLQVQEAFPGVNSDRYRVITNGYDETDFEDMPETGEYNGSRSGRLELVNVGQVYPDAAFGQLLDGIEMALGRTANAIDIRLKVVGDSLSQWADRLSSPLLKGRVTIAEFKPHKEAVRIMMRSDVLLLLLPQGDSSMRDKIIAGKTFELMRSGRPILMIGWEGESSRMIEESGLGSFVSCDDIEAIAKVLIGYYSDKVAGKLSPNPNWDYIRQFERKALTGKLSHLFDIAVSQMQTANL